MSANRRRKTGKPLTRTPGKRPERRTIVVFCEGANSEPDYINALKRLTHIARGTALDLRIHPERDVPLPLVEMAVQQKRDPEVDECWCIFDVEWPKNHPNLVKARALAEVHGVNLAISNPCFELWLVLHFQEHYSFANTGQAERLSRSLDNRRGKSIDAARYMPMRKEASLRAERLDKRHERDGTIFPHDNPSSGMYKFLNAVEGD